VSLQRPKLGLMPKSERARPNYCVETGRHVAVPLPTTPARCSQIDSGTAELECSWIEPLVGTRCSVTLD